MYDEFPFIINEMICSPLVHRGSMGASDGESERDKGEVLHCEDRAGNGRRGREENVSERRRLVDGVLLGELLYTTLALT